MIRKALITFWFFLLISTPVFSDERAMQDSSLERKQDISTAEDQESKLKWDNFIKRMHFGVTGRWLRYQDLQEDFAYSPLSRLLPINDANEWRREWSDWKTYATFSVDFINRDQFLLRPGIHLGASQAKFTATESSANFTESWNTRETLLWGITCTTELRLTERNGPFLRGVYNYFQSDADEKTESIETSNNRGNNTSNRDAHFSWQTHEAHLEAGWRFGPFAPLLGVEYQAFSLRKRLNYHIPEAGADPQDLPVIQSLNSEESRYSYSNRTPWQFFLGFDWEINSRLPISVRGSFGENSDYRVGVLINF